MRLLLECSEEKKWDVRVQERARQRGFEVEAVPAKAISDDTQNMAVVGLEEISRWDGKGKLKAGQ